MTPRRKYTIFAWVIVAQAVALLVLAKPMAPVEKGTSAQFWRFACGVDLGGQSDFDMGGIYQPRDGWYIYYVQGFHGQFLYRVSRSEAVADYPAVLRRIEVAATGQDPAPLILRASGILREKGSRVREDPELFLSLLREEWLAKLRDEDEESYQYWLSQEEAFAERWGRVRRYWVNVAFELVFFSGLALFAFWPWLREKGVLAWCLHLGLLPLLLFLPYYLGYATWTFTSAGPSGGVLYPWVILCFGGFRLWTPLDSWILEATPKVLEPLSQRLGSMLVVSGGCEFGPVAALVTGSVVAAITAGVFAFLAKRRGAASGRVSTRD